jgi:hypothetical protein
MFNHLSSFNDTCSVLAGEQIFKVIHKYLFNFLLVGVISPHRICDAFNFFSSALAGLLMEILGNTVRGENYDQ